MAKKKHNMSGVVVPAGLLIGIGIGIIIEQVAALTLIGLGVGFLVMYLNSHKKK